MERITRTTGKRNFLLDGFPAFDRESRRLDGGVRVRAAEVAEDALYFECSYEVLEQRILRRGRNTPDASMITSPSMQLRFETLSAPKPLLNGGAFSVVKEMRGEDRTHGPRTVKRFFAIDGRTWRSSLTDVFEPRPLERTGGDALAGVRPFPRRLSTSDAPRVVRDQSIALFFLFFGFPAKETLRQPWVGHFGPCSFETGRAFGWPPRCYAPRCPPPGRHHDRRRHQREILKVESFARHPGPCEVFDNVRRQMPSGKIDLVLKINHECLIGPMY